MTSYNHLNKDKMQGARTVETACEETSNDEGKRNWDDDVIRDLDESYPDWRKPSKTYMVPCEFPYGKHKLDDGKGAEKNFRDLLQEFGKSRPGGRFIIYSYNFAEKISVWKKNSNKAVKMWKTGEHDFVFLDPECGLIFFQVNRKHC